MIKYVATTLMYTEENKTKMVACQMGHMIYPKQGLSKVWPITQLTDHAVTRKARK